MNEWKTKCVGLQRTWVSKRTVCFFIQVIYFQNPWICWEFITFHTTLSHLRKPCIHHGHGLNLTSITLEQCYSLEQGIKISNSCSFGDLAVTHFLALVSDLCVFMWMHIKGTLTTSHALYFKLIYGHDYFCFVYDITFPVAYSYLRKPCMFIGHKHKSRSKVKRKPTLCFFSDTSDKPSRWISRLYVLPGMITRLLRKNGQDRIKQYW